MKNFFAASFLFLFLSSGCQSPSGSDHGKNSITISGAFALYPMAVKWAAEFSKLHPGIRIDVSAGGTGKGITDALSNVADIGMVSREIYPEEIKKGTWFIAVAKDAVVPTVSGTHPRIGEVMTTGITPDELENIFITGKITGWMQTGIKADLPVHVYTRADAAGAAESWAHYFRKKQEDLRGVGVFGDPGVAQAVIKDPAAIGYNNIVYVFDPATRKQLPGIRIIPIDFNRNGKIDPEENFYDTLDVLMNAISDGRYPAPPSRDLYFVTGGKPQKKLVTDFIAWILSDGQRYLKESGYVPVSPERAEENLAKLK